MTCGFTSCVGLGLTDPVTGFRITGLPGAGLDTALPGFPTMFPTFLDFTGAPDELTMEAILKTPTPVPEPAALGLLLAGLGAMQWARRQRTIR